MADEIKRRNTQSQQLVRCRARPVIIWCGAVLAALPKFHDFRMVASQVADALNY